jgi:pyridinium-3,5-biscarboxylic acid mononucleotide synthase
LDPARIEELLESVKAGRTTPAEAAERLRLLPFEDLGFAKVDHHRALRKGFPEVVFGSGKTAEQIVAIVASVVERGQSVLVTRTTADVHGQVASRFREARYHQAARCVTVQVKPPKPLPGRAAVLCAGTSDVPVAEEAAITAEFHGALVDRIFDVGVAGLHRLLDRAADIQSAQVVVVVAGMEGALPSVVGGLVDAPVIAVPTSIGYGAAFGGLGALLGMLNSCASGVSVVNIDNGFGAGYLACLILRTAGRLGEGLPVVAAP